MTAPKDKLAVVTGGAVRLGEAISRRLADAGYHVVIHAYSHLERAEALATEIGGTAMSADLSQRSGVEAIFEVVDRVGLPSHGFGE